jgi:hypothetical protein
MRGEHREGDEKGRNVMTCREKLAIEYPGRIAPEVAGGCYGCPDDYGYLPTPEYCDVANRRCTECWDREIPEEKENDMLLVGDEVVEHPDTDIPEEIIDENCRGCKREHAGPNNICNWCEKYNNYEPNITIENNESNTHVKVICISGKAQHGKDTSAGYLKEFLEENDKKVLIAHYGDLVKYVCRTFFDWDGNKDEAGRTLLQYVGTDQIRKKTPDFWVKFIKDILDHFPNEWDYVLIPDCRFPNEINYFGSDYIVKHIRVFRGNFISPLTIEQQKHISETALDDVVPDYMIYNGFGLDELRENVRAVGEKIMGET